MSQKRTYLNKYIVCVLLVLCLQLPTGIVDCASPIRWAIQNEKRYDVIIIYTDSEPIAGEHTPAQTLKVYRSVSGIQEAK